MEDKWLLIFAAFVVGSCYPIQCPFPGLPANGHARVSGTSVDLVWGTLLSFNATDRVEFDCSKGWRIAANQSATITCLANGTWSGPVPRCENEAGRYWWERVDQPPEGVLVEDYCGFPPVPVHGRAQFNDSHTFLYKCDNGYQLNGNATTICDPETGQWSSLPTCEHCAGTVPWMPFGLIVLGVLLLLNIVVLILKKRCCYDVPVI